MKYCNPFLISVGTFIILFSIYLYGGLLFVDTGIFSKYDLLFDADVPRVIADITEFRGDHHRTSVHPLYVLLVNPMGLVLSNVVTSKTTIALFINSVFGALGAVLAFIYFWIQSKNTFYSFLFSILFGFSMSQLFWSAVPETYSLGVCTLLLNYILFENDFEREVIHEGLWLLLGIFTIGVAITNFVQTLILYIFVSRNIPEVRGKIIRNIIRVFGYVFKVLIITIALATVQKMIYPSAALFFMPGSITSEFVWSAWIFFTDPLKVIGQILKDFFIVNIIAPFPNSFIYRGNIVEIQKGLTDIKGMAVTFSNSWNYYWIGLVGIVFWLFLLVIGFARGVLFKTKNSSFAMAIILCLLFEAFFHSYYGWRPDGSSELFLYSGCYTFLTIIIASWALNISSLTAKIILIFLCSLVALNNITVFKHIVALYK